MQRTSPPIRRVAVLVEFTGEYGRGILRGITRYIREHQSWVVHFVFGDASTPRGFEQWHGDGLITRIRTSEVARYVCSLEIPRVVIASTLGPPLTTSGPWVTVPMSEGQDEAVLAIAHFRERGLRQVAFCRFPGQSWNRLRQDPFAALAAAAGFPCHVYDPTPIDQGSPEEQQRHLAAWLLSLPKPIGLWAADDLRAHQVLEACRLAHVHVPEEIAVLGAGDDRLLCELCNPTLSSIGRPYEEAGYQAAVLLDDMMQGRQVAPQAALPPIGVITRQSTEILAVSDSEVAEALRFIETHATHDIDVQAVVDHTSLSKATLQRRFHECIGRSVAEEIEQVRVRRAMTLLSDTQLKMSEVAHRSGFSCAKRLAETFERVVRISPTIYRRNARYTPT